METKSKLMVIQGPNINMLGTRETDVYGSMKMEDIHGQMKLFAEQNDIEIEFFQSNFEGELVDKIHRREEFRQKSLIAPVTAGQIVGFGPVGYHLAMIAMLQIFEQIKAMKAARAGEKAE